MRIAPIKNLEFWTICLLSVAGGIGIAIAEGRGLVRATLIFQILGVIGVIYFVTGVFVLPYLKLKIFEGGFRFTNLGQTNEVQWSDVSEIQICKDDCELEWLIKTRQSELICIMENEYLYRRRMRKNAVANLQGFDENALQQAIESPIDGVWACFPKSASEQIQE